MANFKDVMNDISSFLLEKKSETVKHGPYITITYDDVPSEFWVVTKPGLVSKLKDIVFKTNISVLMLRAMRGFSVSDIVMISRDEKPAKERGEELLQGIQDYKKQKGYI